MKTKLIILGLVAIILGGLGLWATKNQTESIVSITNWKTYTNTQYGFEFSYPARWNASTTQEHDPESIQLGLYHGRVGNNDNSAFFSLSKPTDPKYGLPVSPEEWARIYYHNYTGPEGYAKRENVTINGMNVIKYTTHAIVDNKKNPIIDSIRYTFVKNSLLYTFLANFYGQEPSNDFFKLFDQVIFTFKFTK